MRITAGVFAAALLVSMSSVALAAGSHATGAGVMTEEQVMNELHKQGYSDVSITPSANDKLGGSGSTVSSEGGGPARSSNPMSWVGTAEKNGKQVRITVDSAGHVTEE